MANFNDSFFKLMAQATTDNTIAGGGGGGLSHKKFGHLDGKELELTYIDSETIKARKSKSKEWILVNVPFVVTDGAFPNESRVRNLGIGISEAYMILGKSKKTGGNVKVTAKVNITDGDNGRKYVNISFPKLIEALEEKGIDESKALTAFKELTKSMAPTPANAETGESDDPF